MSWSEGIKEVEDVDASREWPRVVALPPEGDPSGHTADMSPAKAAA